MKKGKDEKGKREKMKKLNKIIFQNKTEDNALFLLEFKFSYFFLGC